MRIFALLTALAAFPSSSSAASLDFAFSSATLTQACDAAKTKADARLAELTRLETPTFKTAFVGFSDILSDLEDETSVPSFLGQVAVEKAVRDAGTACHALIDKYLVDVYAREDVYKTLKSAADRREILQGEDARLLEKTLLKFKYGGLDLPPEQRRRLSELRRRIVELSSEFTKEVSETKDFALFTKDQLAGLPADMAARLPVIDGKYKVTLDYPDYFPFLENARDPEARRILEKKFNLRGGEKNKARLAEILRLRKEAANLLGYKTHADFVTEDRMARTPERAASFLARLRARLTPKGQAEYRTLLAMKKAEQGPRADDVLHAWDWRYYHQKLLRTKHQVDQNAIKEYFPAEVVVEGMLGVYQELLGLRFREIVLPAADFVPAGDVRQGAAGTAREENGLRAASDRWHPDVRLYEASDSKTGVVLGRFYLDLYPREGKYKHAAEFPLIGGRALPDGSYSKPVSAMVANFEKPSPERPSLLTHANVVTLFHEFGHLMHETLTHAKYRRFSGSSVAWDFVETPSKMFENWVWNADVLARMSGHYKDRTRPLPKDLVARMVAARTVDLALTDLRQDFLATYDMVLHTQDVQDTTGLYAKMMKEISLTPMSEGTIPEASLTHLMGYDAGLYSYLWSEVYAQDLFARFQREGLFNAQTGRDLRRWVLEPGGSIGEDASLRGFLGREPDEEAFLRTLGLAAAPAK